MKKINIKSNSKVSLQSLSGGLAGEQKIKHRFIIGKKRISEMGLIPVVAKNSLKGIEYLKNNPKERASDLIDSINDNEIDLVVANIGGFDSHEIIPFLDEKLIKESNTTILGYSDITSIHLYYYNLGIQTYYGPSVLDGFAENAHMHDQTIESLRKVFFDNEIQTVKSSDEWTSEMLDWANEEYDDTPRKMNKEKHGHITLNESNGVSGHLIGGNLDTIIRIKNEDWFPNEEKWKGSIIFLETSESFMSPDEFRNAINLLKKEIELSNGVVFGKPKDETYFKEYLEIIKELISKPIFYNVNFGHTAPIYTIPYGAEAKFNFLDKVIEIHNK